MGITGYSELTPLPVASNAVIYRAVRERDGRRVVLKAPRRAGRASDERWAREKGLLDRVAGEGVIGCLGLAQHDGMSVLVLEDTGARSLDQLISAGKLPLTSALRIGAAIARALARVHAAGVVHKDVNPSNVLVKSTGREERVWLIDFGIASPVGRARGSSSGGEVLEGTLLYLAPEQSGRMNRSIDARSDLYSLGATLYELLVGRPPFEEREPLALVHAHIARQPSPPSGVPRLVADIVMRLLQKAAEDRYQSAAGLALDLERCAELLERGEQPDFELGNGDPRRTVNVPERLYGREAELAALEQAFFAAAAGTTALVRISGPPGIGKTALVLELQERITAHGGVLASGKCEQLDRGEPLSVLAQAFRQRLRSLLSDRDEVVRATADRLRTALGDQIGLLSGAIPELAQLVPGSPVPPPLPPSEQEARLAIAARRLARALTSREVPLVLFLDDLQWADGSTLRLLSMLATDPEGVHLLLVCAHRDVEPSHPLRTAIEDVEARGRPVTAIPLPPLALEHTALLIADSLRTDVAAVEPVAEIAHARTGGNPFYLRQLLESLESEGVLQLDPGDRSVRFDPERIRRLAAFPDVTELLAERIARLDLEAQSLLECAALSGARFELGTITEVLGADPVAASRSLARAVDEGLLDVIDARSIDPSGWSYAFAHDRVQQVAVERISEERRKRLRLALGRAALGRGALGAGASGRGASGPGALGRGGAELFAAVDHLNAASELIDDPVERARLPELNLAAGVRAREAGAYAAALAYLEKGRALLQGRGGELDLSLTIEAAEAAYLATDFERMEALSRYVIAQARTVLDRARAHEVRLNARIGRNDLDGALAEGLEVLALLGIELPSHPGKGHVLAGLARTRLALVGWSDERIASLPLASRPETRAAMRIAMGLASPAYYARPDLLPLLVFAMLRTTLAEGICPESPYAFSVWGLVMASLGSIETGYRSGRLALQLRDRIDDPRLRNRAEHLFHAHLVIWRHPYSEARQGLRRTYESGYTSGDLEYASFSAMMGCCIGLYAGHELRALLGDMQSFGDAIRSLAMGTSLHTHEIHTQAALCLVSDREQAWRMEGPVYDERAMLGVHERANDVTNIFCYHAAKSLLCMVFGEIERAEEHLAWNRAHTDLAQSTAIPQLSLYVDVLVSLRRARALPSLARAALLLRVERQTATLARWTELAPENWSHRLELARALRAIVFGRHGEAAGRFERALTAARSARALMDEALVAEMAFEHQRDLGNTTAARAYLIAARAGYERWGAAAKVRALDLQHPELAAEWRPVDPVHTTPQTGAFDPNALDVSAVLASAQAISKEIELGKLVQSLVRITLQAAGARRATLVLELNGALRVVATGASDPRIEVRSLSASLDEHPCPETVIRYVQRARTDVVLDDAQRDGSARTDRYVVGAGVRSLICLPVEQQGKLSAILCLEHDRAAGVFTRERVALLRVIASQAAIALENARLYGELRMLADAQSRFVPKQFLESLDKPSIVEVRLGDNVRKTMSILFSDIRGFTPMVERMRPEEHIGFINDYLRFMEPPILAQGGFVDSYIGDAIMALFDSSSGGADEALRAGVGMADALAELNRSRAAAGLEPIRMGIGLHTGPLTLGTIGGPERIKCGVIGESVNLAARLEGLTKVYDATLLVSDALVGQLADRTRFTFRTVDRVKVRGSQIPITVLEVLEAERSDIRDAKRAELATYERGVAAYYSRRAGEAVACFEVCLAGWSADPAALRYLERARRLAARAEVEMDWTGVEQL